MKGVVEKYYSARELASLVGFDARFWRDKIKAGELDLVEAGSGELLAKPVEISGEYFVPASAVNAFLLRHQVAYDAGVKARNTAELRRKLERAPGPLAAAA